MNWRWRLAQYLELKWWKNYLHNKTPQDYLKWKHEYWKQLFQKTLADYPIKDSDTITDFGCGPAGCYIFFTDNKVNAIDPLINNYEQLPHFKKSNYPNTIFINSTIEDYPNIPQTDVVLCINAINHVHDINKAMQVVCKSVKNSGFVVLSIDAHKYTLLKWLFRLIPGDALHPHQYSLNEYTQMMQAKNITIKSVHTLKKGWIFNYQVLLGVKS